MMVETRTGKQGRQHMTSLGLPQLHLVYSEFDQACELSQWVPVDAYSAVFLIASPTVNNSKFIIGQLLSRSAVYMGDRRRSTPKIAEAARRSKMSNQGYAQICAK